MEKTINICDVCQQNIATRKCIACGKDMCGQEKCSAGGYFDKYIPYELSRNFDFCHECAKSLDLLSPKDVEGWIDVKYMSRSSFSEGMNKWLVSEMTELKNEIRGKATKMFDKAIKKAKERYAEKIEQDKRKAELQKEIDDLEKRQRELKSKI